MNTVNLKQKPFFDRLPRYALPALQAAWDQAASKGFGTLAIFNGFCRSMNEVGHEAPTRAAMSQWIADVQAGKVDRPGKLFEEPTDPVPHIVSPNPYAPEAKGKEERRHKAASDDSAVLEAAAVAKARRDDVLGGGSKLFFTDDFPAEANPEASAVTALRMMRDRLVSDLIAQFEASARRNAEQLVISVLKDLAAELEKAA